MLKSEKKQKPRVTFLGLNKHLLILIYLDNTLEQEKKVKCYIFGIKDTCKGVPTRPPLAGTALSEGARFCAAASLCPSRQSGSRTDVEAVPTHRQQGLPQPKAEGEERGGCGHSP